MAHLPLLLLVGMGLNMASQNESTSERKPKPSLRSGRETTGDSQKESKNAQVAASLERIGATVRLRDGKITYIFLTDRRLTRQDQALLGALADLETLDLTDCKVDDTVFESIKRMRRLRRLCLWGNSVTDAGLANLKGLHLIDLDLRATGIGDVGLDHLRNMKSLEKLELLHTRVTDIGMRYIEGLTELRELGLTTTRVGDRGLERLSRLTKLRVLELEGTRVTAAGLRHIGGFAELRVLSLHRTKISDASLKSLTALKHLETLYLVDTPITDEGIKQLAHMKSLKVVYLNGTRVSKVGVHALRAAIPDCIVEGATPEQ